MQKEVEWLLKEKYPAKFADAHYGVNYLTKKIKKDLKRLKKGEPLDYVIGFTEFLGCKIDLSKKPLIPRRETEFWVQKSIEFINNTNSYNKRSLAIRVDLSLKILDMFAGSGCIGIAFLRHIKNIKCDFADIDKKNLEQIKINLKINKIKPGRYKMIRSDVFKNINSSARLRAKYDYIFANPPYIAETLRNRIQKSVLEFEPKLALFGGKDGLFYIRKFLKEAKNHLNKNGKIYMEFDYIQKKEIEKMIKKYKYSNYEFHKDQYGKYRFVVVK